MNAEPEFAFGSEAFESFQSRISTERVDRLALTDRIMGFGVKFLDVALGGIFPNDLILLGAKTGLGKTALATRIAYANASKGRRVHYFALEAEKNEIERRIKYGFVSDMVRQRGISHQYRRMNFLDWYAGRLDDVTEMYERLVDKELGDKLKTLHTFYRSSDFYAEQFERMMLAIQDQTDLVILDHLHYVDSEDPNENRGYKLIVKKIRDAALSIGKPVIVVAHIRKGDRRSAQLIPSIEDFHGTSDVPKIATKAIMIAPAYEQPSAKTWLLPTYIAPVKCRFDGARTRYVGLINFDIRTGNYEDWFDLGQITGEKFEIIDNSKMPAWAQADA